MSRKRKTGLRNTFKNLSHDAALQANVVAFLNGTTTLKVDYKNAKTEAGVNRYRVGVVPFYATPATVASAGIPNLNMPVSITKQAVQIGNKAGTVDLGGTVGSKTIWDVTGIEFDSKKIGGDPLQGWYPALAKVSLTGKVAGATVFASTTQKSHITGRTYKLAKRRSGSIPFGRSLSVTETPGAKGEPPTQVANIANADYGEVQKGIEAIVAGYNKTTDGDTMAMSVSYEPEVIRENTRVATDSITPDNAGTITL